MGTNMNTVTLHGKRDFADVIKDFGMGRLSRWPQWTQNDHKGLYEREARGLMLERKRCDKGSRQWRRFSKAMLLALKMEEGTLSQEMQVACRNWHRRRKWFPPGDSRRKQPCWHLYFSPVTTSRGKHKTMPPDLTKFLPTDFQWLCLPPPPLWLHHISYQFTLLVG